MARTVLFVGMSAAAWDIARETEFAANCSLPVLLTGECGVGKTLVGRTIHARSARSSLPLITIDCGGEYQPPFESRLPRELPNGGTILIKEPGNLSPSAQAALLRFLETRDSQASSIGQPKRRVDIRFISLTRRPLFDAVARKRFLPELYYRLNVVHIEIPPLRDRREDVPALLDAFFGAAHPGTSQVAATVSDEALEALMAYSWPGNVRELEAVAQRLAQSCTNGRIDASLLPREIIDNVRRPARPVHEELFARLVSGQDSFWRCVYEPFMAHDLSRSDLRELVRLGIEHAGGDCRALAAALQVREEDYRRFMTFLRQHHALYPFMRLEPARATLHARPRRDTHGA